MIFESHAHYDDEAFDEDRSELLDALPAQGIGRVINVCAEVEGWNRTLDLMERYPYIYGAVGVHPDDVGALDEEKIRQMHQICQMEKTVAVARSAWTITGIKKTTKNRSTGLSGSWKWREKKNSRLSFTAVTLQKTRWIR